MQRVVAVGRYPPSTSDLGGFRDLFSTCPPSSLSFFVPTRRGSSHQLCSARGVPFLDSNSGSNDMSLTARFEVVRPVAVAPFLRADRTNRTAPHLPCYSAIPYGNYS